MFEIAVKPINVFLDFNAVIVNLDELSLENQKACITDIKQNVKVLKKDLEENLRNKEKLPEIPKMGMVVLQQQLILAEAIEKWLDLLRS